MFLTSWRSLASGHTGRDQLVERHRIERQIVAQFVQLQRLVVEHGRARLERHHVFLRRLRVHRDQEVDFLLARDVAVLAGANRVPGRQARDVRREQVLARDRDAHLEDGAQKHDVGVWQPDPLTVATWMLKSLTIALRSRPPRASCSVTSVVAIPVLPLAQRACRSPECRRLHEGENP